MRRASAGLLSTEAVQPKPLGVGVLVAERHSRERGKGMNWDGLERLIESCVGNESINRKGLIRAVIAQKEERVDLATPGTWGEQVEAMLQTCLGKW